MSNISTPVVTPMTVSSQIATTGDFRFSAIGIEGLDASEYTIVGISVDETSSTTKFAAELKAAVIAAVESSRSSPRVDNLLVRTTGFSTVYPGGVREIHGFKPLSLIDSNQDYDSIQPRGGTPLYDTVFESLVAMRQYAKTLYQGDFLANGLLYVITDGDDNSSKKGAQNIKDQLAEVMRTEELESLLVVLVGINASQYQRKLTAFKDDCGLDLYIDVTDASPTSLARLAGHISSSITAQSMSLGSGGPSQAITATI